MASSTAKDAPPSSSSSSSLKDSAAQSHSLAFRVMRMCRPTIQPDLPLKTTPEDLWLGEDELLPPPTPQQQAGSSTDDYFASRVELKEPLDALGLTGMMVLPQSFGSIHLGETFCSYISVSNHAEHEVNNVVIKAELQTERQRVILADNSVSPLERIQGGGRHDFIIEHDIKELGSHTLACAATYIDFGEQKFLPQYFKFTASNPLSVKTKVRTIKDSTFLEACVENCSKSNLFLDRVRFDATPPWMVTELAPEEDPLHPGADEDDDDDNDDDDDIHYDSDDNEDDHHHHVEDEGPAGINGGERQTQKDRQRRRNARRRPPLPDAFRQIFRELSIVRAGGGTRHYLYCLTKPQQQQTQQQQQQADAAATTTSNSLGRLEISWRTTLGEPGRLQTQQIMGNPIPRKEVELKLVSMPKRVTLEHPFLIKCCLTNHTERPIGPLRVVVAREEAVPRSIVVSGPWSMVVEPLQPFASFDFELCLVALSLGVQRLSGVGVVDARDGKPYDVLLPTEVLVEVY